MTDGKKCRLEPGARRTQWIRPAFARTIRVTERPRVNNAAIQILSSVICHSVVRSPGVPEERERHDEHE